MTSTNHISSASATERAILVALALPVDSDESVVSSMAELRQLAWTAGAEVVAEYVQRRERPEASTLIGKGKLHEIRIAVDDLEVQLVVFDSELSPAQGSNLQNLLDVKVIDRTQLILDIFAQRARTGEGKHQVELAQLEYALPRLRGRGVEMTRLGGGIGTRGPGEQKLEVDRRLIRNRIARLKGEMDDIRRHRRVQRQRRLNGGTPGVALVGYTNAGKSSLLNRLTGAEVFVENKLFATLDPTSRRCRLPGGREVVLSDTVGFIQKLPHSLVAAFRATLEEVNDAELLLIVADASHPAVEQHLAEVYRVLDEIKIDRKPAVIVFNKSDAADPGVLRQLLAAYPGSVGVSARTGSNIESLEEAVERKLGEGRKHVWLRIPQQDAGVLARVHSGGRILNQSYENNDILVEAEVDAAIAGEVKEYVSAVS